MFATLNLRRYSPGQHAESWRAAAAGPPRNNRGQTTILMLPSVILGSTLPVMTYRSWPTSVFRFAQPNRLALACMQAWPLFLVPSYLAHALKAFRWPVFAHVVEFGHGRHGGWDDHPGLLGRRIDVDVGRQAVRLVEGADADEADGIPALVVVAPQGDAALGQRAIFWPLPLFEGW